MWNRSWYLISTLQLLHWLRHAFSLPLWNIVCSLLPLTRENSKRRIWSFLLWEGHLFAYASVNTPGTDPSDRTLGKLESRISHSTVCKANQAYRTSSTDSGFVP